MNPGTFPGAVPVYSQQGFKRQYLFVASSTYYIPRSGYYNIFSVGAGGHGALGLTSGPNQVVCSGGGAGGLAIKNSVFLSQGTALQIVVGAQGAAQSTSSGGAALNGNAGGATTVTGGGLSLYAGGGSGGIATSGTWNITNAGGAGGSASGGDLNLIGGAGGSATLNNVSWGVICGGGGAVNFFGGNSRGGNASGGNGASPIPCAGGGGGVGGAGGDATMSSTSSSATGGSFCSAGVSGTNAGATTAAVFTALRNNTAGTLLYNYLNSDLLTPFGYPTNGATVSVSSDAFGGCGSGGSAYNGGNAGSGAAWFAGSGGAAAAGGGNATAGAAHFGGGGGGAATNSGTVSNTAGAGGIVIITWVQ